jgi:hypothetical protein
MIADLRLAFRQLARSPGFTAVAVLTLALGIGLNTSMFSIMNVLLLRPLPYPEGDRLVRVFVSTPQARNWATAPGGRDFRAAIADTEFASAAVFGWWGANLTKPDRPAELLVSLRASVEFLPTLGVQPLLGRWFTAEEERSGRPVILIRHALWQRAYGGDPGVVGRTIQVDREPVIVIGVMPPGLAAPMVFGVVDFWRPLVLTPAEAEDRANRWLHAVARLPRGMALAQADAIVQTIADRIARDQPRENEQTSLRVVPLHASATDDTIKTITGLALALTGFVLLIACAAASSPRVRKPGACRVQRLSFHRGPMCCPSVSNCQLPGPAPPARNAAVIYWRLTCAANVVI